MYCALVDIKDRWVGKSKDTQVYNRGAQLESCGIARLTWRRMVLIVESFVMSMETYIQGSVSCHRSCLAVTIKHCP